MSIEETRNKLNLIREGYIYTDSSSIIHEDTLGTVYSLVILLAATLGIASLFKKSGDKYIAPPSLIPQDMKGEKELYLKTESKDALVSDIKADAKKLTDSIRSNPLSLKAIEDHIKKTVKHGEDLTYKIVFIDKPKDKGIQIIQGSLPVLMETHWVIEDIAEVLNAKYAKPISLGIISISAANEIGHTLGHLYIE
jgi:hypothetical protein